MSKSHTILVFIVTILFGLAAYGMFTGWHYNPRESARVVPLRNKVLGGKKRKHRKKH